jgi:hypothetical protein
VSVSIPAAADGGTVILKKTGVANSITISGTTNTTTDVPVVTNPDGTTTETKSESTDTAEVVTTTNKDAEGNVTSVVEKSELKDTGSAQVTVTVTTDAEDKKTAEATVEVAGTTAKTGTKTTISASVVSKITDAAGSTDVTITQEVKSADGTVAYTIEANAADLTVGEKLTVMKIDEKTGEYVLVNSKEYTVTKNGNVNVTLPSGENYVLLNETDANKESKAILKTIKVKKTTKTIKKKKTTVIALAKGYNKENISKITYTSSKKSVATVNKNGKITAKKAGTVTIKAKVTLKNGKTKTVKMKVKVKK